MQLTKENIHSALDGERLYHFLTHYMKIDVGVDPDKITLSILTPDETAHNWWKILIGKWALTIEKNALVTVIDKINNEGNQYETYLTLQSMIASPSDKTVQLFTAVPLVQLKGSDPLFEETTVPDFFDHIDNKFEKLFHYIEAEFGFMARVMTVAAESYSRDINKDQTQDIYLSIGATDDPTIETEFFLKIQKVPGHNPTQQNVLSYPITNDEKENLFGYLTRNEAKAKEGITIKHELDLALKRLNDKVKEFLHLANDKVGYERTYIWGKIHNILVPAITNISLEPFAVFGGFLGNVDAIETEEVDKIKNAADEFVTSLFLHLSKIPPTSEDHDHYAIDHDNFNIFARDKYHQVIAKMEDPRYTFNTVFEPFYSAGFIHFIKRHLASIKNKYVFSKLGEIIKKPVDREPQSDTQSVQEMETEHKHTLH